MADVKIKRTTNDAPSSLEYGSMGIANNRLYYGDNNDKPIKTATVEDFSELITSGDNINISKASDSEKIVIKTEGLVKTANAGNIVYCTNSQKQNITVGYSTIPVNNYFPQYDSTGHLATNNPIVSLDCVNKQYLEDNAVLKSAVELIDLTPSILQELTPGTYKLVNKATTGFQTDLALGYYLIVVYKFADKENSCFAFSLLTGKIYTATTQISDAFHGFFELATTADIPTFKTLFGNQSITGSGEITAYEAYLSWGGKNISGNFSPFDASLLPALGANRLAFMPAAAITVEQSQDGGTTWVDYGLSNTDKINLFNDVGTNLYIGGNSSAGLDKSKFMVRVTINTGAANVYTELKKFAIYVSTNGSSGCYCTITGRLQSNVTAGTETWNTFIYKANIAGWSGWNILNTYIITYGDNPPYQYGQVRFTFGVTSHASTVQYGGLLICKILGFGGVGWRTPSTLAAKGRMYSWDYQQNVYFPANLYANNKRIALQEQIPTVSALGKTGNLSEGTQDSSHRLVTDTEKTTWNNKYNKPSGGIPKEDFDSDVQASLGKADTALQSHQNIKVINTNISAEQPTSNSENISGNGTINFHKISKTGNYNDLNNKPNITTIAANPSPSGSGSTQLVTLKIDDTIFNLSQVTANPSAVSSSTLQKVMIDGVIYGIPSGGSSDVAAYLSSTYLMDYDCSLEREATMWTITSGSSKYGSFSTRGYLIAGSGGAGSITGTAIGPNGLYKYNTSTYAKMEFTLPNTAGTLVTSKETITYIDCSVSSLGSIASVTLTSEQLNTIVFNYMRVGITLNVTGNGNTYGFYFAKKSGTTLYFATPVLDGVYYVAIVTGGTTMNISMKQLMTD